MRAIVTGGAGFIGSHVVELLLARGHEVWVLDNLSRGSWENVPEQATLVTADIGDREAVTALFAEARPEACFHLAAQIDVRVSVDDPLFDAQQNVAYCTFKDMSAKNQAAHLFMPILDRRPCFIDADRDGKFEATFSVFDKYGSMATPSGNLGDARPLSAPVAYEQADPHSVQQGMRIAFTLSGSKDPERATITVAFDKAGRERWEPLIGKIPRSGNIQTVVNSEVTIHSVSGRDATISVVADPNLLVTGGSGGTLVTTYRPKFLP